MAQIDYRLQQQSGCSLTSDNDGQVAYRLESDRPLEWVGDGLREVGIEPGTVLDDAGKAAARALADGVDPSTGEVLVAPKMAVDPRAKLPAGPFVAAVRAAAEQAGTTPALLLGELRVVARYGRLQRGVAREQTRTDGPAGARPDAEQVVHRAPVGDLQRVADAAGITLDDVYDAGELAAAREHAGARVVVGNRGYDLTLDLPKSYSVLTAMADPDLAAELEDVYLDAVRETVSAVQQWAGYGMRGHHGDGQRAERVDGTGLLGWMTVHRTARPVAGQAPDPHLHAHVTFVNMVRGTDGRWSTIGAGGRDIHRHAHAADSYVKARLRAVTAQRWGMRWVRDERTGAWEVAAVPTVLRERMSKRAGQVADRLQADGLDPEQASTEQAKTAAAKSREAKQRPGPGGDLRAEWHRQAAAAGVDPATVVAEATPGPEHAPAPVDVPAADLAGWVFRPEDGLTGHRKVTTRADVLAAVMDAAPHGITDLGEAEQLVDQVLVDDLAVALPATGAVHLSNSERFTTADIVTAERAVLAAARDRYDGGQAVVADDVLDLAVAQFEAANGFQLSAEQRAVLTRLATAGHGVDTVVGVAGAGKTTLMAALRAAYEATGQTVAGASTAAVAAANLQTEAGITSRTIASWLTRVDDGPGLAGVDVLVVDEAAMVDDRHLARLLTAAGDSGTKVVAIGDPLQLRAVGVGGTFAAVHTMVSGLELSENRRQVDVDERAALADWRADERRAALQTWSDTGRLHATHSPEQAHEQMLQRWTQARAEWSDPHDRIDRLLLLAHTNADVDALNTAAQQQLLDADQTAEGRTYTLTDGLRLQLNIGDQVLARTNDRQLGILNGHRGVVVDQDDAGRVQVERREPGPDGPELIRTWIGAGYVERGGLQLGYAITASKAQGLTADQALVYGNGMDAHVLYPAMSRDRHRTDLWLALDPLESDADRARHGAPRNAAEATQRAVTAYAAAIAGDRPDRIVLAELGEQPEPITPAGPAPAEPARVDVAAQQLLERIAQLGRDVAATTAYIQATTGDQAAAPDAQIRELFDVLDARIAALPDEQLRRPGDRDELRERLRRIPLNPAQQAQADREQRQAAYADLRRVAAGEPPSGQFSREQLQQAATRARAEATRRANETALSAGGRAEQTPQGATGVPHWRDRPYGTVPDDQLPAAIATAEREAARLTAAAQRQETQLEQIRAQAAAGDGPAMRELEQRREQLQAQVAAGALAEAARAQAAAAYAASRQAWQDVQRLEAERQRNPLALRLAGTSRAAIAAEQEQLRERARAAADQAGQHNARAGQYERQAGGPGGGHRAAAELADLTGRWDQHTATARERDAGGIAGSAYIMEHSAQNNRRQATAEQRKAVGLRDEAQLRAGQDPTVRAIEDTGRHAHAQREAEAEAEQAARRAEAQRATRQADYDHHHRGPDIDRGPSLGL
jgi:conjugative relaxase-like TrwC/TraI family protein